MDLGKETPAGTSVAAIHSNDFVPVPQQFTGVAYDVTSTTGRGNEVDMEEDEDFIVFSTSRGGTDVDMEEDDCNVLFTTGRQQHLSKAKIRKDKQRKFAGNNDMILSDDETN